MRNIKRSVYILTIFLFFFPNQFTCYNTFETDSSIHSYGRTNERFFRTVSFYKTESKSDTARAYNHP